MASACLGSLVFLNFLLSTFAILGGPRAAPRATALEQKSLSVVSGANSDRLRGHVVRAAQQDSLQAQSLQTVEALLEDALGFVEQAWPAVKSSLATVSTSCAAQVTEFQSRASERAQKKESSKTAREQHIAAAAGFNAELDHMRQKEEETQASYDSTVSQRATDTEEYTNQLASKASESDLLEQVLLLLREKQATVSAGTAIATDTVPSSVSAGQRFIFERTTDFAYPVECQSGVSVEVLQVKEDRDPSVQVRWEGSEFEAFVRKDDLRVIQMVAGSSNVGKIVGIFQSMLESTKVGKVKLTTEYVEKDGQLRALVQTLKETLVHVDGEIKIKNSGQATENTKAEYEKKALDLHNSVDGEETKILNVLYTMCGYSQETSTGEVARLSAYGDGVWNNLKNRVEQILLTVSQLTAASNVNSEETLSFLTLGQRRASGLKIAEPSDTPSRWITDALSRGIRALTSGGNGTVKNVRVASVKPFPAVQNFTATEVTPGKHADNVTGLGNVSLHNNVGKHADNVTGLGNVSLHKKVRAQPIAVAPAAAKSGFVRSDLVWAKFEKEIASKLSADGQNKTVQILHAIAANALSGNEKMHTEGGSSKEIGSSFEDCANDKKRLTAEIISARRSARDLRPQATSAEVTLNLGSGWTQIIESSTNAGEASKAAVEGSIGQLDQGTYDQLIQNALAKLSNAEATVSQYMTEDPPPDASALPLALQDARGYLVELEDEVKRQMQAILATYQTFITNTNDLKTQMAQEKTALDSVAEASQATIQTNSQEVQKYEKKEEDAMTQRDAVDVQCDASFQIAIDAAASR